MGITQCIIDEYNAGGVSGMPNGGFREIVAAPQPAYVDKNWELYQEVIKGLGKDDLERVSTSAWAVALDIIRADGNTQYAEQMAARMTSAGLAPELDPWEEKSTGSAASGAPCQVNPP